MSLADTLTINARYTRAINLERDRAAPASVSGYIPTPRALHTLGRILDTLTPAATPRAWSLVGPYGAGKSAFAAWLTWLLDNPAKAETTAARAVLDHADPALAQRLPGDPTAPGHCIVVLTGSPEPFARRLAAALADAAATWWATQDGPPPAVIAQLQASAADRAPLTSTLLAAIAALQDALVSAGGPGLLLVIDELGKFLEYEARHAGANDIFLLQAIAERAAASHPAPLTLVVLLHQAMDQYARDLGDTLRNEWAKVQGRFETIPFIETTDAVLRVVAAAFTHDLGEPETTRIRTQAAQIAGVLAAAGALPRPLDAASAADLFARCYPLHPLSALLLPLLCQRVAQNERTLFSYLGSHEPHGLGDSLQHLAPGDWVLPWQVYEYFIRNQSAAVADHFTRRRWMEVVTASERLGDAPPRELRLLQSIGLLNIIGAQGGFKASRELVALCADPPGTAEATARRLEAKAVLQYRKFSGEYRVWEGSDFDLEAAVAEQTERLGRFNLASALNKRHALAPILARRHAIRTGTLRYFVPHFADASNFRRLPERAEAPRIIFYLVQQPTDQDQLEDAVCGHFTGADIIVACPNAARLRQVVAEVMALERVRTDAHALNTDPVAQREYKERVMLATARQRELLHTLAEDPRAGTWYWQGQPLALTSRRGLQAALSTVLDQVYHAAPIMRNELINRDRPSAQAAAARTRLLVAMLQHEHEADLGIDKFPPERAMYLALLREPGLHRQDHEHWQFVAPDAAADRARRDGGFHFAPLWAGISDFLAASETAPLPFTALDERLQAPPYGIRRGVLPILYLAVYLVHQDELALFEEGRYLPALRGEHLERFVRRPGDFAVQRFRIEGLRVSLFREYMRVMFDDPDRERTLIGLARPLAKFMGDLPDYTKTTRRLSETAVRVRAAFDLAKSPQILLFQQLPAACGVRDLGDGAADEDGLRRFADRLKEALRELKTAYPALVEQFQRLFAHGFNLDPASDLAHLRTVLRGRVDGLDRYTIDADGLRAFIRRLSKDGGSDEEWFTNLLLFLGHKPARKWADADAEAAEYRLAEFARRIHDLDRLRVHYDGQRQTRDPDFDVVLLRSVRKGGDEFEQLISIDPSTRAAIRSAREAMAERIANLPDRTLRLALVAELCEQVLAEVAPVVAEDAAPRRNIGGRDD